MTRYTDDRAYSDRFIPRVRDIVGPHLLEPAPAEWDMKHAADLVVLHARSITVGVRIRKPGYLEKWPFDFTIRSSLPSKTHTEFNKIMDGWMDLMFYGHGNSDPSNPLLRASMLIDMHVWRKVAILHGIDGLKRQGMIEEQVNTRTDHVGFISCDTRKWPSDLIISKSLPSDIASTFVDLNDGSRVPPWVIAPAGMLLDGDSPP